jgi:transcription antitermination factor NusG
MDGLGPAKVSDDVIADLRSREREGVIELPKPPLRFKPGDPVRVIRGPFVERVGLVQGLRGADRVAILLGSLGRVDLARDAIVKVGSV